MDDTTEAPDPETTNTETGDTETADTETGDIETGDTETGDTETTDTETGDTETDPLPSEKDLQDADGDAGYDDGSTPDADSLTTFLPHGLRLN